MNNKIVKVNAAEYGIEESKAKEIEALFTPMLAKMTELEKEYNAVIKLPIDPEASAKAKELRLKYVKVRTGTAEIHKAAKAFFLAGGRFVDGWKNAQIFASEGIEAKLIEIEKHQENLERERIQKLNDTRMEQIKPYIEDDMMIAAGIGRMEENVWIPYLKSVKEAFELRRAAEKKAEDDRIAAEKVEKLRWERAEIIKPYYNFFEEKNGFNLGEITQSEFDEILQDLKSRKAIYDKEQKRIRLDNIRLQKEAEERERLIKIEEEKRAKAEAERIEKDRKEREAYEAKIKAEREERERAEKALKEKDEAEEMAKRAEEKRIQDELNKGDEDKVNDLISDLEALKAKYSFKSQQNRTMYSQVGMLIDKIITHIKQ